MEIRAFGIDQIRFLSARRALVEWPGNCEGPLSARSGLSDARCDCQKPDT